jgi:hypothetical protein
VISNDSFRKSSFSSASGCVEVRLLPDGHIAVRDSKDRNLPVNRYDPTAWTAFLAGIRAGEFELE